MALLIMVAGFSKRLELQRLAPADTRPRNHAENGKALLFYLLGQKEILKRKERGIAHLILVWGMVLFTVVSVAAQFRLTLPPFLAGLLSLLLDISGLLMVGALLFFPVQRFQQKTTSCASPWPKNVVLPMVNLMIILLTGFLSEGIRLGLTGTGFSLTSPVGWLVSGVIPSCPLSMQIMIRLHYFSVLFFIASIPYTFMRHIFSSSLQIFKGNKTLNPTLEPVPLESTFEGVETISDFSARHLQEVDACVSCGRCEDHCPAFIAGKPLSPRNLMGVLSDDMEQVAFSKNRTPLLAKSITQEAMWACTTCMACVEQCPLYISPLEKIIELRRYQVLAQGQVPLEARPMMQNLELFGDVNGRGAAHRKEWAQDMPVEVISQGESSPEFLIWVGCSGAFHPAYQKTTRALVKLLTAGGIDFKILGKNEFCCGDPARRMGNEPLFQSLAQKNMEQFKRHKIKRIVTLCPHCFNTLSNEYPQPGSGVKVIHATELIIALLNQKRIELNYPENKTVAIQDPCYLGRYNNIYTPLRDLCHAIPGMVVKEVPRSKKESFCCGGGGGRMWLHESSGRNINDVRAQEFADSHIELVGTACPYCLTMMEDGIKSLELQKPPRVIDIIELAADALKETSRG